MYVLYEFLARLTRINSEADAEIENLKILRKQLVEKNLNGTYSDEIFREQNSMIENKIIKAQIVKDDATVDKYNVEALTSFIKTILADLAETYLKSNLGQLKVFLGAIFPDEITWDYSGTLRPKISPLYQAIRVFSDQGIPSRAGDGI